VLKDVLGECDSSSASSSSAPVAQVVAEASGSELPVVDQEMNESIDLNADESSLVAEQGKPEPMVSSSKAVVTSSSTAAVTTARSTKKRKATAIATSIAQQFEENNITVAPEHNMLVAIRFFDSEFEKLLKTKPTREEKIATLSSIAGTIQNNVEISVSKVNTPYEAVRRYENLNTRGLALSTFDKIKSHMCSLNSIRGWRKENQIIGIWEKCLCLFSAAKIETGKEDVFFRAFMNMLPNVASKGTLYEKFRQWFSK